MRVHHRLGPELALFLALGVAAGCPGSANMPPKPGDSATDVLWFPIPDFGPLVQDVGGGGSPKDGTNAGESGADQTAGPDLTLTGAPGGPCPCVPSLLCVKGACRAKCTAQACNGSGGCAANEACINTQQNIPVCIPASAKGGSCSAETVCAGGLLCLTTDPATGQGTCYSTCASAGAACPGGGTCYALPSGACLFCYP